MAENIETVNQFLKEQFGIDTDDSEPIFRVVWAEDQTEKREVWHTDTGIRLLAPEVREMPKYPWIEHTYVLERRVLVPSINLKELVGLKKSYEPVWAFYDACGNPTPPTVQGCKFIVDTLYAAIGKSSMAKYKDPEAGLTQEELYEKRQAEIDVIQEELFGNESGLKQATLDCGSAIIVPGNYDKIH
jgi:hypothetical protein